MAEVAKQARASDAIKQGGGPGIQSQAILAGNTSRGTQGGPTAWRDPGDLKGIIAAAKNTPNVRRRPY